MYTEEVGYFIHLKNCSRFKNMLLVHVNAKWEPWQKTEGNGKQVMINRWGPSKNTSLFVSNVETSDIYINKTINRQPYQLIHHQMTISFHPNLSQFNVLEQKLINNHSCSGNMLVILSKKSIFFNWKSLHSCNKQSIFIKSITNNTREKLQMERVNNCSVMHV